MIRRAIGIVVLGLIVAACGGGSSGAANEPARLVIEPWQIEGGGSFVEGARSGYAIDPDSAELASEGYETARRLTLAPGEHTIRVQIYPCDGACAGDWDRVAADVAAGRASVRRQLITCDGRVRVRRGETVHATPRIARGSRDCTIGAGDASVASTWCTSAEPAGDVVGPIARRALIDTTWRLVEIGGCALDEERALSFTRTTWSGGLDGCNSTAGVWTLKGGVLTMRPRSSTLIACGGSIALDVQDVRSADVTDADELILRDTFNRRIAVARASNGARTPLAVDPLPR